MRSIEKIRIEQREEPNSFLKEVDGMGFLNINTTLERTKTTCQVSAELINGSKLLNAAQDTPNGDFKNLRGYEIHMGITTGEFGLFKINRLNCLDGLSGLNNIVMDGALNGNVWGTYIHGIFDNDEFRSFLLNSLRARKGLTPVNKTISKINSQNSQE